MINSECNQFIKWFTGYICERNIVFLIMQFQVMLTENRDTKEE
jgi:hypothetical protein